MKLLRYKKFLMSVMLAILFSTKVFAYNPPHVSHKLATMLLQAVALMGVSYHWGGNTPASGMDCSGFVRYVFKKSLGITLPRTAAEMAKVGNEVDVSDLQPGDLLFFNTHHTKNHYLGISHIGIYLGDNKFIQAPHTGEQIQVTEFSGYWRSHFIVAKRIDEKLIDENNIADNDFDDSEENILSDIPDHPAQYSIHRHHKHSVKSAHNHQAGKNVAKANKAKVAVKSQRHKAVGKSTKKSVHSHHKR
jgi:hypothetical protein